MGARKTQIKITRRHHLTPITMAIIRNNKISSVVMVCYVVMSLWRNWEILCTVGGDVKSAATMENNYGGMSKIKNSRITIGPEIPLLCM